MNEVIIKIYLILLNCKAGNLNICHSRRHFNCMMTRYCLLNDYLYLVISFFFFTPSFLLDFIFIFIFRYYGLKTESTEWPNRHPLQLPPTQMVRRLFRQPIKSQQIWQLRLLRLADLHHKSIRSQ